MSVNEKIRRWNRQNEGLEDEPTLKEPSLRGQGNDAVSQSSADTPMTQDFDKEPKEGEGDSEVTVAPSYSDFVAKTPAYKCTRVVVTSRLRLRHLLSLVVLFSLLD
jgi:hypothetical protein